MMFLSESRAKSPYFAWNGAIAPLQTLDVNGSLDRVPIKSLEKMVADPWDGTANYRPGLLMYGPQQYVNISEWCLYARMLEKRAPGEAADVYLRTVLGETEVHTSSRGPTEMYPFRIFALRRLLALQPLCFSKLLEYAKLDRCPGTIRRAIFCVYAANHEDIGPVFLNEIPGEIPHERSSLSNFYVDGMLHAFAALRTGQQPVSIRSASDAMLDGYLDVVMAYDMPDVTRSAKELMAYQKINGKPPKADVSLGTTDSDLTPYHWMSTDRCIQALQRLGNNDAHKTASDYSTWAVKMWPEPDSPRYPTSVDGARTVYMEVHDTTRRADTTRPGLDESIKAFQDDPQAAAATRLLSNWSVIEPDMNGTAVWPA